MAFLCPSCERSIAFKETRPGHYSARCPKCSQKLVLVVSDDPKQPIVAKAIVDDGGGLTSATMVSGGHQQPPVEAERSETADPLPAGEHKRAGADNPRTVSPGTRATRTATGRGAVPSGEKTTGFDLAGPAAALPDMDVPSTLGGFRILKELGHGGMGAVYLARQLSLNRDVAVKVIRPECADDPIFVARFTREAFAAAQLVHHNVVQIHDIGADHDTNYYSMEFVDGDSLGRIVKREGKLDAEVAVGYVLQAARGLAEAHAQGMIHRDIKPDNLMLNRHGVVKVTDLGIVKTPGTAQVTTRPLQAGRGVDRMIATTPGTAPATRAGIAMGTPAYMSPEQARDAAKVDARADIYSLGCALYVLVTGRPPFEGKTAQEVITKHASEPIVPPEAIVKRLPKALSDVVLKMVAKLPEDRYQTMPEVIKTLEDFLGVEGSGVFSPREEHAQALEESVAAFRALPIARLRPWLILAFFVSTIVLALIASAFSWRWAVGFVGLTLSTALAHFVLAGVSQNSYLLSKVRELVFGSRWKDWCTWTVGAVLLFVVLYLFGWLWVWIGGCVLAVALAAAFHYTIDARLDSQRQEPLEKIERMLLNLRSRGLDEDALRQFVCKYAGKDWEEFYEALFGYEAKLAARERWGRGVRGKARAKYGAWRDPLVRWIEARQALRRDAKSRRHLQTVEEKGLQAAGVDAAQARRMAQESVEKLVARATARLGKHDRSRSPPPESKRASNLARSLVVKPLLGPLEVVFGPNMRFMAGAALIVGCAWWIEQNHLINPGELKDAAAQIRQGAEGEALKEQSKQIADSVMERIKQSKPLDLQMVPDDVTGPLSHVTTGLAGLLLLVSAFCASRAKVVALLVVAVALFAGHWLGIAWPAY